MLAGRVRLRAALLAALLLAPALVAAQPAQPPPDDARAVERQLVSLNDSGRFFEAVPVAERLAELRARALGPEHPDAVAASQLLGHAYRRVGDLRRAALHFGRVLSIRERSLPAGSPLIERALINLAEVYREQQDHERAEPLLRRLVEAARGTDRLASALTALAGLLVERGDLDEAVTLYEQAVAAVEAQPPPSAAFTDGADADAPPLGEPPRHDTARARQNLARALAARGDLDRAQALAAQALAALEQTRGPDDPSVAVCLNNLALILHRQGKPEAAAPLFRRSIELRERGYGADHPSVAVPLNNLSGLAWDQGDFAEAERLSRRALGILERGSGPDHPRVADVLSALAGLALAQGRITDAIAMERRAADIQHAHAQIVFLSGSERQKLSFMARLERSSDAIVSLHAASAPRDPAAARLALTTVLRRKGLVLDAMAQGIDRLRRSASPEDEALLAELSATAARRATLIARGPGALPIEQHRANLRRLEEEQRRIEAEISRRSAAFRAEAAPVTIEEVQAAIPEGAALVELVVYRPYDARRPRASRLGSPRYVAYALRREGEVASVDLGEASRIDELAAELRRALAAPALEPPPSAAALDALVLRPILPLLGGARRLLISPDGALGLVPLGALMDEGGRYRVERLSMSYLTSGRDLVRRPSPAPPREGPLVIANPAFGPLKQAPPAPSSPAPASPEPPAPARGIRSALMAKVRFKPLRGTAAEAAALGPMLRGARVLVQEAATEAALKAARGPRVLHVATHGFFLPDKASAPAQPALGEADGGEPAPREETARESPLLRGGLALAGANQRASGDEDGILTALEASTLDLRGTRLVVLSACETGVGEVQRGEGVHGLRRALAIAGAEAVAMSLWRVDDEATRDLMVAYYQALAAGRGRAEALRDVQLAMLGRADTAHPYYWAGFILAGEGSPIDGLAVATPKAARVAPGSRGCGCGVVELEGRGALAVLVALAAAAARRRRRRR